MVEARLTPRHLAPSHCPGKILGNFQSHKIPKGLPSYLGQSTGGVQGLLFLLGKEGAVTPEVMVHMFNVKKEEGTGEGWERRA